MTKTDIMQLDDEAAEGVCKIESDLDAPRCPICGSPAVVTEYSFDIHHKGWLRHTTQGARGMKSGDVTNWKREECAYYRCPNDCLVGEWQEPAIKAEILAKAREMARKEWDSLVADAEKRQEKTASKVENTDFGKSPNPSRRRKCRLRRREG